MATRIHGTNGRTYLRSNNRTHQAGSISNHALRGPERVETIKIEPPQNPVADTPVIVDTTWGEATISTTTITPETTEAYLNGQCWSLAANLANKLHGGHIGLIIHDGADLPYDWEPEWGTNIDEPRNQWMKHETDWVGGIAHVVAIDKYGWLYDVNGQHESEGMAETAYDAWGAEIMVTLELQQFMNLMDNDGKCVAPMQDYEAAHLVSILVLDRIPDAPRA